MQTVPSGQGLIDVGFGRSVHETKNYVKCSSDTGKTFSRNVLHTYGKDMGTIVKDISKDMAKCSSDIRQRYGEK